MTYIGIDPGKDGALAVIIDSGKASIVPFDQDAYRLVLRQFCMQARMAQTRAVLEHVGAMPGQGVTSMFSFGENFGYIKGLLEAFEIPNGGRKSSASAGKTSPWRSANGCSQA